MLDARDPVRLHVSLHFFLQAKQGKYQPLCLLENIRQARSRSCCNELFGAIPLGILWSTTGTYRSTAKSMLKIRRCAGTSLEAKQKNLDGNFIEFFFAGLTSSFYLIRLANSVDDEKQFQSDCYKSLRFVFFQFNLIIKDTNKGIDQCFSSSSTIL